MADSLGGILTDGMGADYNGLILGPFRLKITAGIPFVPPSGGGPGSGGAATGAGLPIPSVDDSDYVLEKRPVRFELKVGEKIIDKTFMVHIERADRIIQVTKWVNTFIVQTQFRIGKFKRKYGEITANFKKKDK